jgi:hypothetical protein
LSISSKRAVVVGALALLGLGAVTIPSGAVEETGWRIAAVSPAYEGDGYASIAATGPDDAWAVGNATCCDPEQRKMSHWNGTEWEPVTLPPAPDQALYPVLRMVGASSPDDVWTFGDAANGPGFGHHWDGTAWTTSVFGKNVLIDGTAVLGPDDAWFTGSDWSEEAGDQPVVEHYDGGAWTRTPLPASVEDVNGISASSAASVWVLGWGHGAPVTLHWDGSAWRSVGLPMPDLDPGWGVADGDILSIGPKNAWASGILAHDGLRPGPVLWHWNGKRWRLVPVDSPQDSLTKLAPDGRGGLWMVSAGPRPTADLLHYTGAGVPVTREPAPVQPGTTANVDRLVLIPGTRSLWGAATLVDADGHSAAAIDRYDPTA